MNPLASNQTSLVILHEPLSFKSNLADLSAEITVLDRLNLVYFQLHCTS
jgi:hypothetical protein